MIVLEKVHMMVFAIRGGTTREGYRVSKAALKSFENTEITIRFSALVAALAFELQAAIGFRVGITMFCERNIFF